MRTTLVRPTPPPPPPSPLPSPSFSVHLAQPTSPWRFALDVDPASPGSTLRFESRGYRSGAAPWNHSNWPTSIAARLRPLPTWSVTANSAAEPPRSPACDAAARCGPAEVRDLVPHGGTELRIGELPVAFFGPPGDGARSPRISVH
mmetsp:Transcript_26060/g.83461  ORF Transcript_26060/g.83461 Transcript_26060/m.83461 type:complete len:146 (-) Transcript_26060:98-535(-)